MKMGRPINGVKELCRQYVFNDQLIERLSRIATSEKERTADKLRAIELLLDRGFGKAEQAIEITENDNNRPTTESLIETIRALREELATLREGANVEAKQ